MPARVTVTTTVSPAVTEVLSAVAVSSGAANAMAGSATKSSMATRDRTRLYVMEVFIF